MAKDIKTLKTDDIVKEITKLFSNYQDLYVEDDGDKFIINLNKIIYDITQHFSETYDVDVDYDFETECIDIHKKKFPSLQEIVNKYKQEEEIKQQEEVKQKEENKHKVQSNGLTLHDEELIDLAYSTSYRSSIRNYIREVDTDKAKQILRDILTDAEVEWED